MDDLSDEVRQAFLDTAPGYAKYQADLVLAGTEKQTKYCIEEQGMNIVELWDEERTAWADALPPLAIDWAKGMDEKGYQASELLAFYRVEMRAGGDTASHRDEE